MNTDPQTTPAGSLLSRLRLQLRDRRRRARLYGISSWDQLSFEGAARVAYKELVDRDQRILFASFDGTEEPIVMVFARGKRASDVRHLLSPIINTDIDPGEEKR